MLTLRPFVLTLLLDAASFATLDDLRRQYFPPERNFLPAHVTLFHALPAEREDVFRESLRDVCAQTRTLPLRFPGWRFLGKGVAVEIDSPELLAVRAELSESWGAWLGAQDRQKYRPHATVQNKVEPEKARALYEQLTGGWRGLTGRGEGLLLWRYLGGPWELIEEIKFTGL
ncbi:MAG TPA: 2'-5' RNA ligase family protein [Pyrinomonadaceae bacterium]|jgi:hypothetical protein|nr:2'-5' RNA ligase family protein [Pyrinomonadaceae bacterium]